MVYTEGGSIPASYFDPAEARRTVHIEMEGQGRHFVKREYLIEVFDGIIPAESLKDGIWRVEKGIVWNVCLPTAEMAKKLVKVGSIVCHGIKFNFSHYDKQRVELRVHWLPLNLRESFIRKFFGQYGDVLRVEHEMYALSPELKCRSGVRRVVIELSDYGRNELPHVVRFNGGVSMLITAPGRLPICLKCSKLGHTRTSCPLRKDIQRQVFYEQAREYLSQGSDADLAKAAEDAEKAVQKHSYADSVKQGTEKEGGDDEVFPEETEIQETEHGGMDLHDSETVKETKAGSDDPDSQTNAQEEEGNVDPVAEQPQSSEPNVIPDTQEEGGPFVQVESKRSRKKNKKTSTSPRPRSTRGQKVSTPESVFATPAKNNPEFNERSRSRSPVGRGNTAKKK